MDTDKLNRWLTLGANVGVLIGLVLLIAELQQTNAIARAEAINGMTQNSYTILQMYREPRSASALDKIDAVGWGGLSSEEELVISAVESMVMGHIQNAYFQHKLGVIDDGYFDAVLWNLDQSYRYGWRREYWESAKASFASEFRTFVDGRLPAISREEEE